MPYLLLLHFLSSLCVCVEEMAAIPRTYIAPVMDGSGGDGSREREREVEKGEDALLLLLLLLRREDKIVVVVLEEERG